MAEGKPIRVELFPLLAEPESEKKEPPKTRRLLSEWLREAGHEASKPKPAIARAARDAAALEPGANLSPSGRKSVKPAHPKGNIASAASVVDKETTLAAVSPAKTVSILAALTPGTTSTSSSDSPTMTASAARSLASRAQAGRAPIAVVTGPSGGGSCWCPDPQCKRAASAAAASDAAADVAIQNVAMAEASARAAPVQFPQAAKAARAKHTLAEAPEADSELATSLTGAGVVVDGADALSASVVAGADAGAGAREDQSASGSTSGASNFERLSNSTNMGGFDFYVDKSSIEAGYVECAKCKQIFRNTQQIDGRYEVRVLPCFHSVCGPCLESELSTCSGEGLECPICSRSYKKRALHDFLPNFDVLSSIEREMVGEIDFTCEECILGNRAEIYCGHCVMNLCKACASQHQRAKATARHPLLSLIEQDKRVIPENAHRAQFCATHRTRRFEYYCEDCESLICYLCCLEAHQSHSYKLPSSSLVAKHRKNIEDVLEKLNWRMHESQELQKKTNQTLTDVESSTARVRAEIEVTYGQMKKATESRCSDLKRNLADKYGEHRHLLDKSKADCSSALVDIWRTIDFLEKVIDRATNIEVLKLKEHVFQDRNQLRQWQHWTETAKRSSSSQALRYTIQADWKSASESKNVLTKIMTAGHLDSTPHALLKEIMSTPDDQESARLPPVTLSPPGLTEQAPSLSIPISDAGETTTQGEETDTSDILLRWMRMPRAGDSSQRARRIRKREIPARRPRRSWSEYDDDTSTHD